MRVTCGVVVLVVLVSALGVSGRAMAADTKDTAAQEQALQTLLVDKLGPDAKPIRVVIDGAKVRLFGTVAERSTKELAEEVVRSARGDCDIANDLKAKNEKKLFGGKGIQESEDTALEMSVKSKLGKELGEYDKAIEVEAADGVVSLRGEFPDEARHGFALKAARSVDGVKKVIDLIKLKS
jgi:hypothetical protein